MRKTGADADADDDAGADASADTIGDAQRILAILEGNRLDGRTFSPQHLNQFVKTCCLLVTFKISEGNFFQGSL